MNGSNYNSRQTNSRLYIWGSVKLLPLPFALFFLQGLLNYYSVSFSYFVKQAHLAHQCFLFPLQQNTKKLLLNRFSRTNNFSTNFLL